MNDYDRGRILDRLNTILKLDDKLVSQLLLAKHACNGKMAESGELTIESLYGGRINTIRTIDLLSYCIGIDLDPSMREDGTIRKINGKQNEEQ